MRIDHQAHILFTADIDGIGIGLIHDLQMTGGFHIPDNLKILILQFRRLGIIALFPFPAVHRQIEFRTEGYMFEAYRMIEYDTDFDRPYYGRAFEEPNYIGAATLVWNTFLGPVSIGLNYFSSSNDKLLLNINFGYIIFNTGGVE